MNKYETLRRYTKGREKWNIWANGLLDRKEKLKKAGKWKVAYIEGRYDRLVTVSADDTIPEIQEILDEAFVDFSRTRVSTFSGEFGTGGHWVEGDLGLGNYVYEVTGIDFENFSGFIFPGDITFNDAVFEETTDFEEVNFHGLCDFTRAKFNDITSFDDARFLKGVSFEETVFEENTSFSFTEFGDKNDLSNLNMASFDQASFKKKVDFNNSVFTGPSFFLLTEFFGWTDFNSAVFEHDVTFRDAVFKNSVQFKSVTFSRDVVFREVEFNRQVDFSETSFKINASFEAIQAKRAFSLRNVNFTSNIPNFTQANFAESPRLDHIEVLPAPYYKSAPKIFGSLKWQRYFWLKKIISYLVRIVRRIPLKLTHILYFPLHHIYKRVRHSCIQFFNTRRNPDEEAHYRALKRIAIQAHDHENEMKFFAGEIRARRHITDFANFLTHDFASSMRYWAGVAYELFSDFGRSFIRPALWWFACLWLFANLTLSGSGLVDKTKCHNSQLSPKEAAYTIGLKNSLLILGLTKTNIVKQAELCLYGLNKNGMNKNGDAINKPKPYNPKIKRNYKDKQRLAETTKTDIPFKAAVQGITHSGLSLLFIFLLLLAIRNQFKIK